MSYEHADRAARWLEGIMKSVADAVVNGEAPAEERVLIETETCVCQSWGEK